MNPYAGHANMNFNGGKIDPVTAVIALSFIVVGVVGMGAYCVGEYAVDGVKSHLEKRRNDEEALRSVPRLKEEIAQSQERIAELQASESRSADQQNR